MGVLNDVTKIFSLVTYGFDCLIISAQTDNISSNLQFVTKYRQTRNASEAIKMGRPPISIRLAVVSICLKLRQF